MSIYYGKNGILRLFDSTKGRDLSQSGPKEVHISEFNVSHSDITAAMLSASGSTQAVLEDVNDYVYVGQIFKFSKITIDLDSFASADGGALICEYWNGSSWVAVSNLLDGTASGGNTMQQDGTIEFDVPSNWAKNDPPTTGTTLYYVRFRTTNTVATDPVAELIEPSSGQYFEVIFCQMDLNAPEGRGRPEELPRMNRGSLDDNLSYIQGLDDPILEPSAITWSCLIDSVTNRSALREALLCGNPNNAATDGTWVKTGISTKTDSQMKAGLSGNLVSAPAFTDPDKKTIAVQMRWDIFPDTPANRVFREYNEVLFLESDLQLVEAADGITMNITGQIYGSVRTDLTRFGYRL